MIVFAVFAIVHGIVTSHAEAQPTSITVEAEGLVAEYLERSNQLERIREKEFRQDNPQNARIAANVQNLRLRAGKNTRWLNEFLFEDVNELGMLEIVETLIEKHAPLTSNTIEVELLHISIPNGPIADWNGATFSLEGTIRERNESGDLITEQKFRVYQPYQYERNVPYTGKGYIVTNDGGIRTPGFALAAKWALKALGRLYPDEDIPRLYAAIG